MRCLYIEKKLISIIILMSSENQINIITSKKAEIKLNKTKSNVITAFLFIFVIILLVVANFIGKQFFNVFIFLLMFGFPLLVIYRNKIAEWMPENIANYLVDTTEDVGEDIQTVTGKVNPLFQTEVQMLFLGILCVIIASMTFYKRVRNNALNFDPINKKEEIAGLLTFLFFTIMGMIFINDLF